MFSFSLDADRAPQLKGQRYAAATMNNAIAEVIMTNSLQRIFVILITLGALFLSACNLLADRLSDSYGCAHKPDRNDIVGTWMPDEATAEETRRKHKVSASTKIMLRKDGSFEVIDMPDWWLDSLFKRARDGFKSGSGVWELSRDGAGCWKVDLEFPDINLYSAVELLEHKLNQKPKHVIRILHGDPDHDEGLILIRRE